MRSSKKITAVMFAACLLLSGCGGKNNNNNESLPPETTTSSAPEAATEPMEEDDGETISIYTGREVENEEDLAIFKFNCTVPEGFETQIDNAEGKQFASPFGGIVVKAQNYKEEFQELAVMADSGCASIKISNMLNQADTDFSEPKKMTIAGFDAIEYDYTVTSYIFPPLKDENGEYLLDEDGKYILSEEKELWGEYVNRVYYFYSDEDVFYIICESSKEDAEKAAPLFDQFIESITISKK